MIQQDKQYKFLNRTIVFSRWGKVTDYRGRFGGGWKYKFGVQIGGSTIIVNLLFGMIRIDKTR